MGGGHRFCATELVMLKAAMGCHGSTESIKPRCHGRHCSLPMTFPRAKLNEFLILTLAEDGYAEVNVRVKLVRAETIVRASRTDNDSSKKCRQIRLLMPVVQKRFGFQEAARRSWERESRTDRASCAMSKAGSLRYKLRSH